MGNSGISVQTNFRRFLKNREIYVKLIFLRYAEAIVVEKANIILQNELQILSKNLEIEKFHKSCEIIPGFSVQAKSQEKKCESVLQKRI